jgi:hypothetical protein
MLNPEEAQKILRDSRWLMPKYQATIRAASHTYQLFKRLLGRITQPDDEAAIGLRGRLSAHRSETHGEQSQVGFRTINHMRKIENWCERTIYRLE